MHEIATALSSPLWWLTSCVMAFAMSLLAYYAGPRLDRILSSVSERARRRESKKAAERRARIEGLIASDPRQTRLWLFTIYCDLLAIKCFCAAVLVVGVLVLVTQLPGLSADRRPLINLALAVGTMAGLILLALHSKGFRNFELLRDVWREEARRSCSPPAPGSGA